MPAIMDSIWHWTPTFAGVTSFRLTFDSLFHTGMTTGGAGALFQRVCDKFVGRQTSTIHALTRAATRSWRRHRSRGREAP